MQFSHLLLLALPLLLSSFRYADCDCWLRRDNSTFCKQLELNLDEPARVDRAMKVAVIDSSRGSISAKTLEPFQDTERLSFYFDEISRVEDGALCSLPNLEELHIYRSFFPNLTKGILRGCQRIQKFETHTPLEEDALHEMTNVKDLKLIQSLPTEFNKAYLEPLKHLETLSLVIDDLKEVDTGLFCSSPVLEEVNLYVESHIQITESLFEGCSSLKKLYITAHKAVIEGNPFSNLPQLEDLYLSQIPITHITKDFLTGFSGLRKLQINGFIGKIDGDAFTNIPHLTNLAIPGAKLHESDLEALHPLSELVILVLSANVIESLDSLPALPSLENLDVGFNSISTLDIPSLKQKVPKLKELYLELNPIAPEVKEELEKDKTIEVNFFERTVPY